MLCCARLLSCFLTLWLSGSHVLSRSLVDIYPSLFLSPSPELPADSYPSKDVLTLLSLQKDDLTDVAGNKQLVSTLKEQKDPKNELADLKGVRYEQFLFPL